MIYVIFDLFTAALYVSLFQNLIFGGGSGASEAIRMAAKPKTLFPLSIFIVYFSVITSVICRLVELIPQFSQLGEIYHTMLFYGVLCVLYLVTLFVVRAFKSPSRVVRRVGIAAFNTLVLSIPFINYRAGFTIPQAIGSGLGAGVAFVIAVCLINIGLIKLEENTEIPQCFKGTPAIFIYVSILALAFTGLAGRAIFV